jgi:hypothetical protein
MCTGSFWQDDLPSIKIKNNLLVINDLHRYGLGLVFIKAPSKNTRVSVKEYFTQADDPLVAVSNLTGVSH